MTYEEFVNNYNGKAIDYDGVSGVQCVDLAKVYLDKVFGIKAGAWGNAHAYYDNFNNIAQLRDNFDRIANTASFAPQKGDICVWSKSMNGYGHIAIATGEGNTNEFYTYDQNWNGKAMHKVKHNYKNFSGVLRAKKQVVEEKKPTLRYKVHLQDKDWTGWQNAGEIAGTTGEERRLEAIILQGENGLDLQYRVHMQNLGWSDWVTNGQIAGTTGQSRRIEAIEIKSNKDLEVQEHLQNVGWMPSSHGNEIKIGTEGKSLRLEAFKINVV